MRLNRTGYVALALGYLLPAIQALAAQCVVCGAPACDDWVCRPKHTTRMVETSIWDTVCEPICVPGCAKKGCASCGTRSANCDDASACDSMACDDPGCPNCDKGNTLTGWLTGSRRVRMRHRLVRKTVVECVPTVEYVVEPRCDTCRGAVGENAIGGHSDCDSAGFAATISGGSSDVGSHSALGLPTGIRSEGAAALMTIDNAVMPPLPYDLTPLQSTRRRVALDLDDPTPTVWLGAPSTQLPIPANRRLQGESPPNGRTTLGSVRTASYETIVEPRPVITTQR